MMMSTGFDEPTCKGHGPARAHLAIPHEHGVLEIVVGGDPAVVIVAELGEREMGSATQPTSSRCRRVVEVRVTRARRVG